MSKRTCSIDRCERDHQARGWCGKHYGRWRAHGDPLKSFYPEHRSVCTIDGCDKKHLSRGWCAMHYWRWKNHGDPGQAEPTREYGRVGCDVVGCDEPHSALGMCQTHRTKSRKFGLSAQQLSKLSDTCLVCGGEASHLDHCHSCDEVRGHLCHGCNTGIGITDNPDLLEAKAKWLRDACGCHSET